MCMCRARFELKIITLISMSDFNVRVIVVSKIHGMCVATYIFICAPFDLSRMDENKNNKHCSINSEPVLTK